MGYAHDIGAGLQVVNEFTLALTSAAAGITTASTAAMGGGVDRLSMGQDFNSMKAVVSLFARVTSTSGSGYCTVGLNIEDADSSNSTSYSAYTTATTITLGSTSAAAATNYYGIHSQDVDLAGAKRWVRSIVTITKVATSSFDTVQAEGVLVFGGAAVNPPTT